MTQAEFYAKMRMGALNINAVYFSVVVDGKIRIFTYDDVIELRLKQAVIKDGYSTLATMIYNIVDYDKDNNLHLLAQVPMIIADKNLAISYATTIRLFGFHSYSVNYLTFSSSSRYSSLPNANPMVKVYTGSLSGDERYCDTDNIDRLFPQELLPLFPTFIALDVVNWFNVCSYHGSGMRTNVDSSLRPNLPLLDESDGSDFFSQNRKGLIGLELELSESGNHQRFGWLRRLHGFFSIARNQDFSELFDASADSSLNGHGVELVSLPMSYNYLINKAKDRLVRLYDWVYGWGAMNGSIGSMHIHFDRSYFRRLMHNQPTSVIQRFNSLVTNVWGNVYSQQYKISRIVGRRENPYCATREDPVSGSHFPFDYETGGHNHRRWYSLDSRTLEIRRYAPNLNFDDLLLKVDFTYQVFESCASLAKNKVRDDLAELSLKALIQRYYIKKLELLRNLVSQGDVSKYTGVFADFNGSLADIGYLDALIETSNRTLANFMSRIERSVGATASSSDGVDGNFDDVDGVDDADDVGAVDDEDEERPF